MAERLEARHCQRRGRFQLPPWDGLDTRTYDLGGVRPQVDYHRQHGGLPFGDFQPQGRQSEEDEEQLHQERRVADQLDIHTKEPRKRLDLPRPYHGADSAQGHTEGGANGRQLKGEQRATQEQVGIGQHRHKVELIGHR